MANAQPSAAVEDATKTQAPTDSTRLTGSSEHQLPVGGKSEWDRLGDEFVMPTPQHKGVRFLLDSRNPYQGEKGNGELDEIDRWSVTHSHFVRKYDSVHSIVDPSEAEEYTVPPPQHTAAIRPSVRSSNPNLVENGNDELDELDRWGVTHSHFVRKYDSVLSIVDSSEAGEDIVPPPRYRAVRRPFVHFTNLNLAENGNDEFDETDRWGVTHSHFVHKYDFVHNIVDPSEADEYTVPPPQHTAVRHPLVYSSYQHPDVNDKSASDETKRTDNGLSTNTRGSIEEHIVKHLHSRNPYQGENGNDELDKIGRWGFTHSHFVRKYDSVHSNLDPSEADEYTVPPPQHTAIRGPLYSSHQHPDASDKSVSDDTKRTNIGLSTNTRFLNEERTVKQLNSIDPYQGGNGNGELHKIDRWGVTHSHFVPEYNYVHSIVDPFEVEEYNVSPPQHTAVRHPSVQSTNPKLLENINDELDEIDHSGVTHSHFVRKFDSVLSIVDFSEADEYIVPPPRYRAVRRPFVHFTNLNLAENGNNEFDETERWGVTHSHFVNKYDSVHSIIEPSEAEEYIVPPPQHTPVRRPLMCSSNQHPNVNDKSASDETKRTDNGLSTNTRGLIEEQIMNQLHSRNPYQDEDGNNELDKIGRWGFTHSHFVRKYDSVHSILDPSEAEEYTIPPPQHTTVRRSSMQSSNSNLVENRNDELDKIDRWGVTHSHFVRNYESVHSMVDSSEADEDIVPHPQHTTVRRPLVHFNNPNLAENGNDELDETGRWGVTHSCFVRKYDSVLSIVDPSGTEEYTIPPPQHTAVRDPLVYSSSQHPDVNDKSASDEIKRNGNDLSTNTRGLTEENTLKQLNSRDPYQAENGNDEFDETERWGVNHSHFVRKYDSVHSIADPSKAEEYIVDPSEAEDGNDELDETDRWGVTHSCFVRKYDSVLSIVDPSGTEEYSIPPPQHTAVRDPLVYSSNQHLDVNDKIASDETKRADNDLSTNTRGLTEEKTVKHLRLWNALTISDTTTIYEARCQMVAQNVDVLVLTDSYALPSGILRHKDIETRVLDCEIDLMNTPVSKVMKHNPIFVSFDTLAVEALNKMVEGEVTQLPVIENGKVIGLVCILDCLHKTNSDAERRALRLCVADWDALQKYC